MKVFQKSVAFYPSIYKRLHVHLLKSPKHPSFLRPIRLICGVVYVWFALAAFVFPVSAAEIKVKPDKAVIVVPAEQEVGEDEAGADRRQRLALAARVNEAAGELQKHLALVTGREIPIVVADAVPEGSYAFFVGIPYPDDKKPLAPEEARWRVTPEGVYLYGDTKSLGPVFAVYDFLESQLGIRWIEPGDRGIAYEKQSPSQLKTGESAWAPELLLRKIRTSWRPGQYGTLEGRDYARDFAEYQRSHEEHDAFARDVAVWQKRMRMWSHDVPGYGHAFTTWWKQYGAEHPEYFALRENGKREPKVIETMPKAMYTKDNPRGFQEVKMCVSNPALVNQIIKNWVDGGQRSRWINVCENDGSHGYCVCEECLKLDVPKEGEKPLAHLTDRYVHLANAVAREARKIDPKAGAVMYAYDRYMLPPRREKVEPNVAIAFVPVTVELDKLEEFYGAWEEAGAKLLIVRPNYHTYYNTMVIPAGFDEHMFKVFQVAYKHGARVMDYDSLVDRWPITGLSDYVLARAFSDPQKPFEYWVDQYCSAFGPASGDVKRYFAYWRNELWNKRFLPNLDKLAGAKSHGYAFARNLMRVLDQYYKPEDFDATDAILQEAAAKKLTDPQRQQLDTLILANRHARLTYEAAVAEGEEKFVKAKKLIDFREAHKAEMDMNLLGIFIQEARYFGDVTGVQKTAALREYDFPWLETASIWKFRMDPENVGEKEGWQRLSPDEMRDWYGLRVSASWENPNDKDIDPALAAKLKTYDGVAWYATQQRLPGEMKGRKIFLYFGGVDESCWVYVNGELAGSKVSEGTKEVGPFAIEIGPQVDWSKEAQEIVVRVEDKGGRGGIPKRPWIVSKNAGEEVSKSQ